MTVGAVLGTLTVRSRQENVARCRRFVGHVLRHHPDRETAVLLASELVANAIVHGPAGGWVTVVALRVHGGVRVEVSDAGTAGDPRVQGPPDHEDEGGRGLFLVEQLADRWDHCGGPDGRTVWFEIAPGGRPDAAQPGASEKSSMVS